MKNILIIEDDKDIAELIEFNLKKEGFGSYKAFDGKAGLKKAAEGLPDLIILDLMLPKLDGIEVCKTLKQDRKSADIPIIMLTAKSAEVDRILGIEIGADDYLTKPFSVRELIARIKRILKRVGKNEPAGGKIIKFPGLEIDIEKHEVIASGKKVKLTAKEFSLLQYLAENQGRVISRERLLDTVWGIEVAIETRTVDAHVKRLRKKLGPIAAKYITTLIGVGYKFSTDKK